MKQKIFYACFGFVVMALLFSCKKVGLIESIPTTSKAMNEKIKDWLHEQESFVNYQKFNVEGRPIQVNEIIAWEKSTYFPDSKTNITPVYIESVNGILPLIKYLVTTMDDKGKVISGNYYVVLTDKMHLNFTENKVFTPELFNLIKIPVDFTGAIIKYDLSNKAIRSNHFDKGIITNKTDIVTVRKSKTLIPVENYAPLPEGCGYVTIDWYWQTWINGVLVYEEYIGSSNIIVCEGGGGGGGGSGGNGGLTCEQQNENFVNMGIAFNGPVAEADVFNNGITWIKSYNWPIYKAGFWSLFSYERGTLEKVYYHAGQSRWEFQSFQHLQIAEVGTNVGGTRTFTDLGATINITASRMSAWVQIDFSVTSKASCYPYPMTLAYSSFKTFYAPNSVVYE